MISLKKLTLELFLYDLRELLGSQDAEIERNKASFRQKLPESIRDSLQGASVEVGLEYRELLKQRIEMVAPPSSDPYCEQMEMYWYPVHLGDSYGLLLNCAHQSDVDEQEVNRLQYLHRTIKEKLNDQEGSLGQTWVISGSVPNAAKGTEEKIARECYKILMPSAEWEESYQGQGRLLGATVFELWGYNSAQDSVLLSPQKKHHVIIVLYPSRDIAKRATRFLLYDWMRLFWYRSKILWAYGQSRNDKRLMKKDFIGIQDCVKAVSKTEKFRQISLKKKRGLLEDVQDILSRYGIELRYLDIQKHTIEINLRNYQKRLVKIREDAQKEAGRQPALAATDCPTDLKFLETFSQEVGESYLRQVQKDYDNLSPGLELLDLLINSIRSVVEVEKAERESIFQNSVAIVGVGLGATSILAALPGFQEIAKNDTLKSGLSNYMLFPDAWLNLIVALIYSVGSALIFGTLTGVIIWLRQRFR